MPREKDNIGLKNSCRIYSERSEMVKDLSCDELFFFMSNKRKLRPEIIREIEIKGCNLEDKRR